MRTAEAGDTPRSSVCRRSATFVWGSILGLTAQTFLSALPVETSHTRKWIVRTRRVRNAISVTKWGMTGAAAAFWSSTKITPTRKLNVMSAELRDIKTVSSANGTRR